MTTTTTLMWRTPKNTSRTPILESDVQEAIRRLPKNKAMGIDYPPVELLKTDNPTVTKVLCKLRNKILETGKWPTDKLRSVLIPIPKTTGPSP